MPQYSPVVWLCAITSCLSDVKCTSVSIQSAPTSLAAENASSEFWGWRTESPRCAVTPFSAVGAGSKKTTPICQAANDGNVTFHSRGRPGGSRSCATEQPTGSHASFTGAARGTTSSAYGITGLRTRSVSASVSPIEQLSSVTHARRPAASTRGRMRIGRHSSRRTGNLPSVTRSISSRNAVRSAARR